jgi:hypothetical protein
MGNGKFCGQSKKLHRQFIVNLFAKRLKLQASNVLFFHISGDLAFQLALIADHRDSRKLF